MTNAEILCAALRQSAVDESCGEEDFLRDENVVVLSEAHPDARRYLELPFSLNLVTYGSNIVASVSPELRGLAERYLEKYPVEHCFETPHLHVLEAGLREMGQRLCFMAEYFLPDVDILRELPCPYGLRVLTRGALEGLYAPQWSNALSGRRRELDVLGVGAFHGENLVGLAACSADCDTMWQIGIDVLPRYRRRGIAAALTSRLALEILERGKVPFYCAAWSNLPSVRNAIKSGLRPAWVEITAKPGRFVEEMNRR